MWIIDPPPSQGRIRYPLGSISALAKQVAGGPAGPPVDDVNDLSQICNIKGYAVNCHDTRLPLMFSKKYLIRMKLRKIVEY